MLSSKPATMLSSMPVDRNDAQLDAGGQERQENCWVGDLTKNGAKEVLNLHGHKDKTDELESEVPVWPSCFNRRRRAQPRPDDDDDV